MSPWLLGAMLRAVTQLAMLALVLMFGAGCQRKAPGPEECVGFARILFGFDGPEPASMSWRYKERFDAVVVLCLTEPFDRRVLECSQATRAPLDCLRRFQVPLEGAGLPLSPGPSMGYEIR